MVITIIVADDHPALRAGVVQAVAKVPDIAVIGEAGSGPELWELLANTPPNVLLLDINMPDFNILKEVPRLSSQHPALKILVITIYDNEEYIRSLVKMGVAGYLLKEESLDTYINAIYAIAGGGKFFSQRIVPITLKGGMDTPALTLRETEVLQLVAMGITSEQIANKLSVVPRTVNFHIENICCKLNTANRTAAAVKAIELGLISNGREE